MLTIEQIKAISPIERETYVNDIADAIVTNRSAAAQWREEERTARDKAIACEHRASNYEYARATLVAAGLWPVPADGGAPCAD